MNVNDETAAALRDLAAESETSVTEMIRRATGLYKFVQDELNSGKELELVDKDNKARTRLAVL
ncbi:ribbon-helix-helix protein, CopG family [Janibacter terrae]|uniref:ribbon-helix-helix protein, CopG family n=1 Tax=Janibacter terrae TaxID=103817 RepID=UPI0031F865C4